MIASGQAPYSITLSEPTWDSVCQWFEKQKALVKEQWYGRRKLLYGLHVIIKPYMKDGTARVQYSDVEEMRREHERQED